MLLDVGNGTEDVYKRQEKYRAFAGASDAGSKGNAAEDIEPKSKNGI